MSEDRDDLTRHYIAMRQELMAAIDGFTDEQLTVALIDGWSVKDHLSHIAAWDELRATEVVRISEGFESAWRMSGGQDTVYSSLAHELRHAHSLEQIRWELAACHQRLLDAIAGASSRGLEPSNYGEAGLRSSHEAQHTEWLLRYRDSPSEASRSDGDD